jgi:hypothetical protein
MAEFGERSGLAVRLTDETYNIRARGAQMRADRALQEHKAAMQADDMKYANVMNARDRALVSKEANDIVRKMGGFIASNPGYETNREAMAMYNSFKQELRDLPSLASGALTDAAYKSWQEDMATNKDELDPDDWDETRKQWEEHQAGTGVYADKNIPFKYIAPTPFNGQQIIMDNAVKLQGRERLLTSKDYAGDIGPGATIKDVSGERAVINALGILANKKQARGFSKEWAKISPEERGIYKGGMAEWLALRIQNETGRDINTGAHYKPDNDTKSSQDGFGFDKGDTSPYWEHIGKQGSGWSGSSNYIPNLMDINYNESTGKGQYVTNDGSVIIPTPDGSIKKFFIPGMQKLPYDATVPGKVMKVNGVPYGTVRFSMPINQAMGIEGSNKMFDTSDKEMFEGTPEEGDYQTDPQYKGIFDVERDTENKTTGNVLVTALVPLKLSAGNIQKYNAAVAGQAYAQKIQQPTMNKIEHNKNLGKIITNKTTGQKFMIVEGGYQPIN